MLWVVVAGFVLLVLITEQIRSASEKITDTLEEAKELLDEMRGVLSEIEENTR